MSAVSREWEEVRLDEIGTIVTGKTPSTKVEENFGKEYPFITPRDMDDMKYVRITERYLSKQGIDSVEKQVLKGTSICVSCIGSDMGKVMLSKGICVTNQQINSITKIKENYDIDFIYYSLKPLKEFFHKIAGGSTMPIVNKSRFSEITIPMPPLEEQKAIAHILSTLDEKIETNNQINKTLEKMAQTIFKHWFVDFEFPNENGEPYKSSGGEMVESELGMIPKGWGVGCIGDVSSVISKGTTPTKKDIDSSIDEPIINFLKVKDIDDEGNISMNTLERIPNSVHLNKLKRSILKKWDILFSIAGTIGRVATVDSRLDNSNANQAIAFIRLNEVEKMFVFILFLLKSENIQNEINANVVQAVQANASLGTIKSLKCVLPRENVINRFNKIVFPIYNNQTNIRVENEKLTNLRDLLLPKLMSGEIRVPLKGDDIS